MLNLKIRVMENFELKINEIIEERVNRSIDLATEDDLLEIWANGPFVVRAGTPELCDIEDGFKSLLQKMSKGHLIKTMLKGVDFTHIKASFEESIRKGLVVDYAIFAYDETLEAIIYYVGSWSEFKDELKDGARLALTRKFEDDVLYFASTL